MEETCCRVGSNGAASVVENVSSSILWVSEMATHDTPHFVNDIGVEKIHIGVKEFQCIGVHPPMDHPHIYLDMGTNNQIVCPYCSTLYTYDPNLGADQSDPPYCLYQDKTD
jgi:uncharacterized Zn-finger protein